MREYYYMIGGMDYMLNEKNRRQSRQNPPAQEFTAEERDQKTVSLVRVVLIALSNLLTR